MEEGGEDERKKKKGRKVDHLARPDKVHYFLWISYAILPPALPSPNPPPPPLRYLASRRIRITVSFSSSSLLVLRSTPHFLLRWFPSRSASLRSFIYAYFDPSTCRPTLVLSYELVPSSVPFPSLTLISLPSFFPLVLLPPSYSRSHPPQVR